MCGGRRGFTLLEMSIVLVIISIATVALVNVFPASLQKAQYQQTTFKMDAIQKALYQYRLAFNRLPCPADATIPVTTVNFGVEGVISGSCITGSTYDANGIRTVAVVPGPTANFTYNTNATPNFPPLAAQYPIEGMVPTKTLQLPDDYAFDGWGRRIMYAVSKDITQAGAFTAISAIDLTTRMTILFSGASPAAPKSTIACEVLFSFGPNGHGAYPRNGGTTRVSSGSTNTDELNNCDCDNSATSTGFDGVFVQKDWTLNSANPLDTFDDIVYFSVRGDYILPVNVQAQPFGLNASGQSGLNASGMCPGGGAPNCVVYLGTTTCQCLY